MVAVVFELFPAVTDRRCVVFYPGIVVLITSPHGPLSPGGVDPAEDNSGYVECEMGHFFGSSCVVPRDSVPPPVKLKLVTLRSDPKLTINILCLERVPPRKCPA